MEMTRIINKTMDRSDLLTCEARLIVQAINNLIKMLYSKDLYMTSWYGTLFKKSGIGRFSKDGIKYFIKKILRKTEDRIGVGSAERGAFYKPLSDAADDGRIPWYLYWEIFWIIKNGPQIKNNMRLLDAGGTSSLFSCYVASLGAEVHSVDLNKALVSNANKIASVMGWNLLGYTMNMEKLDFENEHFDHAYSICVFEHLDYKIKQSALHEIARCLKPGGILSVTFDYRNPAPAITGRGSDISERNRLQTKEDIKRNFLSSGHFELLGNQEFYDNGQSYLFHPRFNNSPYTFGSIFLKKKD